MVEFLLKPSEKSPFACWLTCERSRSLCLQPHDNVRQAKGSTPRSLLVRKPMETFSIKQQTQCEARHDKQEIKFLIYLAVCTLDTPASLTLSYSPVDHKFQVLSEHRPSSWVPPYYECCSLASGAENTPDLWRSSVSRVSDRIQHLTHELYLSSIQRFLLRRISAIRFYVTSLVSS
ncbi:hypothetical protein AUEXF2481DRAFT_367230 [Aureobasidium subglaciale EXF-2481]|uniref:Uncharacterized protein n=1 Tax=Aureobasidium subglaciale (strain EXF-2481) TaxID=1043005 RepID=A0A074Z1I2_AURSE|nr:uncharacterized protein AUEXF2481DRAFT_367230 [Aureobasidium subglaciale EXF-2481]KEQ92951.1 hypothetical protein AUEXF2481DRAFT_367230 [Aureobasidium subglaciale EXF-2481]